MTDAKYKKFDHVSIAVKDAAKVIETWTDVLGIGPWSSYLRTGGPDGVVIEISKEH